MRVCVSAHTGAEAAIISHLCMGPPRKPVVHERWHTSLNSTVIYNWQWFVKKNESG